MRPRQSLLIGSLAFLLASLAGCKTCPSCKVQSQAALGDSGILSLNGTSVHIRPATYAGMPVTILQWDATARTMKFEIDVPSSPDIYVSASDGTSEVKLDAGLQNVVTLTHVPRTLPLLSTVTFHARSRTGNQASKSDNAFTSRPNPELPHLTPVITLPGKSEVIVWADFDGVRTSFRLSEK